MDQVASMWWYSIPYHPLWSYCQRLRTLVSRCHIWGSSTSCQLHWRYTRPFRLFLLFNLGPYRPHEPQVVALVTMPLHRAHWKSHRGYLCRSKAWLQECRLCTLALRYKAALRSRHWTQWKMQDLRSGLPLRLTQGRSVRCTSWRQPCRLYRLVIRWTLQFGQAWKLSQPLEWRRMIGSVRKRWARRWNRKVCWRHHPRRSSWCLECS